MYVRSGYFHRLANPIFVRSGYFYELVIPMHVRCRRYLVPLFGHMLFRQHFTGVSTMIVL